jgi:hypothetical protein
VPVLSSPVKTTQISIELDAQVQSTEESDKAPTEVATAHGVQFVAHPPLEQHS